MQTDSRSNRYIQLHLLSFSSAVKVAYSPPMVKFSTYQYFYLELKVLSRIFTLQNLMKSLCLVLEKNKDEISLYFPYMDIRIPYKVAEKL